jgi:hypothetical protein
VDEEGQSIRINADDIKYLHEVEEFNESCTLEELLNSITIDDSIACEQLQHDFQGEESLYESVSKFHWILKPLLKEKVCCEKYGKIIELGEFDSEEIVIETKGKMIRNEGEPAFKIKITVDGYAPTTMKIKFSEVFYGN